MPKSYKIFIVISLIILVIGSLFYVYYRQKTNQSLLTQYPKPAKITTLVVSGTILSLGVQNQVVVSNKTATANVSITKTVMTDQNTKIVILTKSANKTVATLAQFSDLKVGSNVSINTNTQNNNQLLATQITIITH